MPWLLSEPLRSLSQGLIAYRWWLVVSAIGLWIAAWTPASDLRMDRRIEQMFSAGDPAVGSYELLQKRFGGNEVVMLVYPDDQAFSVEGIQRVRVIADRVRQVEGVRGVLSIAEVNGALEKMIPGSLFGSRAGPVILTDHPLVRGFENLFASYTHNRQKTDVAIIAMLEPQVGLPVEGDGERGEVIARLERIARSGTGLTGQVVMVGAPVLVTTGFNLMDQDGQRLATTTLCLLSLVVFVLFRSLRWVAISWAVIGWSVVITRAVIWTMGYQLSMVSSMLTAVVTIIAYAAILHFAIGFTRRRQRGDVPSVAASVTLERLLVPLFWACITDAVGFAALLVSTVGPVRDFGVMMAVGALVVLVGILLIVPAGLMLPPHAWVWRRNRWRFQPIFGLRRWDITFRRRMVHLIAGLLGRRRSVLATLGILVGFAIPGLAMLEVETNFLRNFRSESSIARAYAKVENCFDGAGAWDVLLPAPSQTLTDGYLDSVRRLERKLRAIRIEGSETTGRISKTLSMADADKVVTQYANPIVAKMPPNIRVSGMRVAMPVFADALWANQADHPISWLRVMLRSPEGLSAEVKQQLIAAVEKTVWEHTQTMEWIRLVRPKEVHVGESTDPRLAQGHVTGYYVLLARLVDNLLSDQWWCLLAAGTAVMVILWVAFGSFAIALVATLLNALPVLLVMSTIGWLGQPMNMGGAMIAAVSIGLTIDGSIHFLASYQRARTRFNRSPSLAVLWAQGRVGIAVCVSTFALMIGFSVLVGSPFMPTATFGVLLAVTLLVGALVNLTVLPVMLVSIKARRGSVLLPFQNRKALRG